jgi:cephalosporin-C deacetylase-like acetyl esterase
MPVIILILLFSFFAPAHADVFQSEEMRQLWDVPTAEVQAKTVKTYDRGNIRIEELYYQSRSFKRKPVKIFGYFAYPRVHQGKLPAILLSHGGGGTASRPRAVAWAKRGYAVLAIDLPGKGENRSSSRSTGPDMNVPVLLRTQPDPSYNYLVHAVAAARNGITYLTQRKEVDPERIGMIGLSWGGVLTLLTNGQDNRLKAAVNVFGAGYIPEGCTWEDRFFTMSGRERDCWNAYIDPKNFLASQHAPILFITGTNDHCYYLPTFQKSFAAVGAEKSYWLVPNLRHKFLASAEGPALAWLDSKLKQPSATKSFPQIKELPVFEKAGSVIIPVSTDGAAKRLRLYYARGGPRRWTAKKWLAVPPYLKDGVYYFSLPTRLLQPEALYFVSVQDARGGAAASLVRSLFRVRLADGRETFALSSSIRQIFRHERPIVLLNGAAAGGAGISFSQKENLYEVLSPQPAAPKAN